MDIEEARGLALSLPGAAESPHFDKASFRVSGKIFATIPPDGERLHVFVEEHEIRAAVEENPLAFEELWWGKRLVGVRITLSAADSERVRELLEESWRLRAPKPLTEQLDAHLSG